VYTIEPRHDTYVGNFLFGILTAVLSTPCTAPLFPGLLAWAVFQAKTGGRFVGVGVITMVGVGMAIPYLLLSAFPELARRVPRTGPWSELVKQLMGFLVLGVAGYFAGQQLLAGNRFMWVVFAIAVAAGIFLILRTAKLMPRPRPVIIAVILALCIGSGTFALAHTLNKPSVVTWQPYSADAVEKANQSGKLALVDLTAKWCANCQWIEATTYADPEAVRALSSKDVAMFKADLTNEDAPGWAIVNELNPGGGIPLTAIYSPKRPGQPYVLKSIYRTPTLLSALDAAEKGTAFNENSGKDMSALFAFSIALLVGVIFNVMPCVLPVLPLKAIGFYEVSQHNRAKSISYGLVFSLGIIATFAALALLVLPVAGPAGAAVAAR
jgi:thiol:disulfide interchange protein DsbD